MQLKVKRDIFSIFLKDLTSSWLINLDHFRSFQRSFQAKGEAKYLKAFQHSFLWLFEFMLVCNYYKDKN